MTWLASLAAHERDGTPAVLVTVLDARGSAPREAGAKLVVTAAAQDGSIGGGALEHRCTEFSRALLAERAKTPVERAFPLGPELGQCCGGHVRVLFEPLFADAWPVALFGAGHVGQAVARLLADLPCRLRWIDSRADQFPALLPATVRATVSDAPEQEVARLAPGSAVLVMTHDHALDYRIVARLSRPGRPAVGRPDRLGHEGRPLPRPPLPRGSVAHRPRMSRRRPRRGRQAAGRDRHFDRRTSAATPRGRASRARHRPLTPSQLTQSKRAPGARRAWRDRRGPDAPRHRAVA